MSLRPLAHSCFPTLLLVAVAILTSSTVGAQTPCAITIQSQSVGSDTFVVSWLSAAQSLGYITVVSQDGSCPQTVTSSIDTSPYYSHSKTVSGLYPNTTYSLR